MKYDFFSPLTELCRISLELCNGINEKNTTKAALLKNKSAEIKNQSVDNADKAFITPIDREDTVKLYLILYRLNEKLADISCMLFIEKASLLINHISDLCKLFCYAFENRLHITPSVFSRKTDKICENYHNAYVSSYEYTLQSPFDTKNLIKRELFAKIDICFDLATEIADHIVITAVKNT